MAAGGDGGADATAAFVRGGEGAASVRVARVEEWCDAAGGRVITPATGPLGGGAEEPTTGGWPPNGVPGMYNWFDAKGAGSATPSSAGGTWLVVKASGGEAGELGNA